MGSLHLAVPFHAKSDVFRLEGSFSSSPSSVNFPELHGTDCREKEPVAKTSFVVGTPLAIIRKQAVANKL